MSGSRWESAGSPIRGMRAGEQRPSCAGHLSGKAVGRPSVCGLRPLSGTGLQAASRGPHGRPGRSRPCPPPPGRGGRGASGSGEGALALNPALPGGFPARVAIGLMFQDLCCAPGRPSPAPPSAGPPVKSSLGWQGSHGNGRLAQGLGAAAEGIPGSAAHRRVCDPGTGPHCSETGNHLQEAAPAPSCEDPPGREQEARGRDTSRPAAQQPCQTDWL